MKISEILPSNDELIASDPVEAIELIQQAAFKTKDPAAALVEYRRGDGEAVCLWLRSQITEGGPHHARYEDFKHRKYTNEINAIIAASSSRMRR